MSMHVVIAGGGTGGHLFPGLAVAEELKNRGVHISFVGTSRGLEANVVPKYGYPFYTVDVTGIKGKGFSQKIKSIFRLPRSAWQARKLLASLHPDVVIGVGGYASGPMAVLAAYYGIPVALLEQNSIPGLTNRISGRLAKEIFLSFPDSASFFPDGRTVLTGNPIRSALLHTPKQISANPNERVRILVLGGSLGAHAVNQLVVSAIAILFESNPKLEMHKGSGSLSIVHQTGVTDEQYVMEKYHAIGLYEPQVKVVSFIEDMGSAYANTDLMIGRAGATTIAEITAMGLPSILIPLPTASDDHQTHNAYFLEKKQAAYILKQNETSPKELAQLISSLCKQPEKLQAMSHESQKLSRPYAAKEIADRVLQWIS